MEKPIACKLEATDARSQIEEWREFLSRMVGRTERSAPDTCRFWLTANLDELPALASLAQREKACCGFFTFTVEPEANAIAFVVQVPEDASMTLDHFVTLAGSR